jgi:hypothetical protein
MLPHSQNLIKWIGESNKIELAEITSKLLPEGKPDFAVIRNHQPIKMLEKSIERKVLRATIYMMVKSFCESINVIRNMNEDQMIDCASMMLDECGTFRLEDYQVMFTMAKRGKIGKIMDRLDISVISQLLDEYWTIRNEYGKREQERQFDTITLTTNQNAEFVPKEKVLEAFKQLQEARKEFESKEPDETESEQRRKERLLKMRTAWEQ